MQHSLDLIYTWLDVLVGLMYPIQYDVMPILEVYPSNPCKSMQIDPYTSVTMSQP
jgi:hypothetical protein